VTETDKDQTRQKIAVALEYELGTPTAPRVTAKGKGDVAERIVEIAEASGVHVEHNEPFGAIAFAARTRSANSEGTL
jgi:flagellar biosynthesis protein